MTAIRDVAAGARLAVTTLTVAPMRPGRVDRPAWGVAMLAAPFVGALLGAVAAGVQRGARELWGEQPSGSLLAAAVTVATLAVVTRGLHLDGLADTTDALGCSGDRARRLDVLRDTHVGAFGVAALVLVVLVQVLALAYAIDVGYGVIAVLTAAVAGRVAVTWSCLGRVPSARTEGLGAQVAATVAITPAVAVTAVCVAGLLLAGVLEGGGEEGVRVFGAIAAALVVGWLVRRAAVRRFGGITGDVLGAIVELATTAAYLAITIRAT